VKIIVLSLAILFMLTSGEIAFAQRPLPDDLEVYIDEKIGESASLAANVIYQSNMFVVLRGDFLIPHYLNPISNTSLSEDESAAAGAGSRDNPDRLYVVMTKQ
jgi:hypothetical protein